VHYSVYIVPVISVCSGIAEADECSGVGTPIGRGQGVVI